MVLPVVTANRFCTRYAPNYYFPGKLTRTGKKKKHRFGWLCRDQQCEQRVEHDIHNWPSRRVVLQRRRWLVVPQRHVHRYRVRSVRSHHLRPTFFFKVRCSFTIGSDGSLVVTVGAHQAIAVHTGALGQGASEPMTADLVPVLFSVNATTTLGEVFGLFSSPGVWSLNH